MHSSNQLEIIEKNHLHHFKYFPKILHFLLSERNGVEIINCLLGSSMFNIVYGSLNTPSISWEKEIEEIIHSFNRQPFAWWIPPSKKNIEFTEFLIKNGFNIETQEHAMICDLAKSHFSERQTELNILQIKNPSELADFIEILKPYDNTCQAFYGKLTESTLNLSEKLFIGYIKNEPMVIGILFEDNNTSAIFSLLTSEHARGKGYGTDMMKYLLEIAKSRGNHYVTLSASSDSGYRIYERLGFKTLGEFECFEYHITHNE